MRGNPQGDGRASKAFAFNSLRTVWRPIGDAGNVPGRISRGAPMRVIAIASQKGGSGKTTLTGHLAIAAEQAGFGPVALIDADPQGSLSEWWNERQAETPLLARSSAAQLAADIARMRALDVALLIVDTPPPFSTPSRK
jgi:hypothetical protein